MLTEDQYKIREYSMELDMKIQAATFYKIWVHRSGDGKLVLMDEDVLPNDKQNQEFYRALSAINEELNLQTRH